MSVSGEGGKTRILLSIHEESFSPFDFLITSDFVTEFRLGDYVELLCNNFDDIPTKLLFRLKKADKSTKQTQYQFSILKSVADGFQLNTRSKEIWLSSIINPSIYEIEHIALSIKDQYVSRISMWRLKESCNGECMHVGKRVYFRGMAGATVQEISLAATHASATVGIMTENTKVVFRSESAKVVLFLQISEEMWEFDDYGNQYLEIALNEFLPELFDRWKKKNTNHVYVIVLFARVYYEDCEAPMSLSDDVSLKKDVNGRIYEDFYDTAMDWEAISDYSATYFAIKSRVAKFKVSIMSTFSKNGINYPATFSKASNGNILEATNLALNIFDRHNIDRDFTKLGLAIIVISAANGFFNVHRKLSQITKERIIDNGIFLHLVCMGPPPLFIAPLFNYINEDGTVVNTYTVPHWVDCSFFSPSPPSNDVFISQIRCGFNVYEENQELDVPYLVMPEPVSQDSLNALDQYELYDANVNKMMLEAAAVSPPKSHHEKHHSAFDILTNLANNELTLRSTLANLTNNDMTSRSINKANNEMTIRSAMDIHRSSLTIPRQILNEKSTDSNHGTKVSPTVDRLLAELSHRSLSPTHSSPSHQIINPCNPAKNPRKMSSYRRRWLYVYPNTFQDATNVTLIGNYWKSLIAPPSLPLETDYLPLMEFRTENYREYTYLLSTNEDNIRIMDGTCSSLLQELIYQRLSQGYQIVRQGPVDFLRCKPTIFSDLHNVHYLSLGNLFHKIHTPDGHNVEVIRYVPRETRINQSETYMCRIRPKLHSSFLLPEAPFSFSTTQFGRYNWNYLDHFVAGYEDEMTESLKFWKTRFILIPSDPPGIKNPLIAPPENDVLSDEEVRVAGFFKFVEVFEKYTLIPASVAPQQDKAFHPNNKLDIQLTTSTSTAFIKQCLETLGNRLKEQVPSNIIENITKSTNLPDLAKAMQQSSDVVSIKDRRWHLRLYKKVFIGSECIDWLLRNVCDIESRQDAVDFGNYLLKVGVIEHVLKTHTFLDGYYYYKFSAQYDFVKSDKSNSASWFKPERKASLPDEDRDKIFGLSKPPTPALPTTVICSKKLVIDVDTNKKSVRREWANLHYDTIHNPNMCYHFQLHWILCSVKLIDEMVQSWGRRAQQCGFTLVEAPIDQAMPLANYQPFQAPTIIKFAVDPPDQEAISKLLKDRFILPPTFFEEELLREHGFILDLESDAKLGNNPRIIYSYAKPIYKNTQYIHKTGMAIVQVCNTSRQLLWSNNRLLNSRLRSNKHDALRTAFESFCTDPQMIKAFWMCCLEKFGTESGVNLLLDELSDHFVDGELKHEESASTPPDVTDTDKIKEEITAAINETLIVYRSAQENNTGK